MNNKANWRKGISFILLAAICVPIVHADDCNPPNPPNDGWGANYSSYAAWCRSCGGTPYNNNGVGCNPGANWGGSSSQSSSGGGGYVPNVGESIALSAAGAIGYAIGSGLVNMLFGGGNNDAEARAARLREQARQLELERQRQAAEAERQRQWELKKQELLKEMKGSYSGELQSKDDGATGELAFKDDAVANTMLQLKDLDADRDTCVRDEDFNVYATRQEAFREIHALLAKCPAQFTSMKARADWCSLNISLPPSPHASGYCAKKPVYDARMDNWMQTCDVALKFSSATARDVPPAGAHGGAVKRAALPEAIAYCQGVYDSEVNACGEHDKLVPMSDCVNAAIHTWNNCQDRWESASPMATETPAMLASSQKQSTAEKQPIKANDDVLVLFPGDTRQQFHDRDVSALLPKPGESDDAYAARFMQSHEYGKMEMANIGNLIRPGVGGGSLYPRGEYPSVDKVVDEGMRQIGQYSEADMRAACQKAAKSMEAEYANMQKQGLLRPGEDIKAKEKTDRGFAETIGAARRRVVGRLDEDIRANIAMRNKAINKLEDSIPVMRQHAQAGDEVEKYLLPGDNSTQGAEK